MTLRDVLDAQPTRRLRLRPPTADAKLQPLEISHARRLRRKLAGAGVRLVLTAWGVGYRLLESTLTVRTHSRQASTTPSSCPSTEPPIVKAELAVGVQLGDDVNPEERE